MSKNSNPTQTQRVLDYIEQYGSITQLDAFKLGIMRLASRINDLRKAGYEIETETKTGKNRYGETTRYAVYKLNN